MDACRNGRLEAKAQFTAMDGIVGTHKSLSANYDAGPAVTSALSRLSGG